MPNTHFIQPYAKVVILDGEGDIQAVSTNLNEVLGEDAGSAIGRSGEILFSRQTLAAVRRMIKQSLTAEIRLTDREPVDWGGQQLIPHHSGECIVLEVEPRTDAENDFPHEVALRETNQAIIQAQTTQELLHAVCERLANYLHYDRVVVYDLEPDGSGVITEEFNNGKFPKLKGTRYRKDDFPMEAHHRYETESVLSYANPKREKTAFVGDIGGVEEMILNCLGSRDIYPTLEQFTREAGIEGYLSIALWDEGELWGMLFAHAKEPVYLDHQLRTFAHLIGNLTSQALVYRAFSMTHRQILASEFIRTRIRENLASASNLVEGLQRSDPSLTDLIPETSGAAVLLDGELVTIGLTPPVERIRKLLNWANTKVGSRDVFATDNLSSLYQSDTDLGATASGIMVIPLNIRCTEWIIWFRGERAEKVTFGSRKEENLVNGEKRFESTVEIRRGYCLPWTIENRETARDLQTYIRDVIMERYGQLTRINHRLQVAYEELQSFSYTVSHDLRAPLRGIDGFAEILMEDYGPQIEPEGKALIKVIQENAGTDESVHQRHPGVKSGRTGSVNGVFLQG